MMVAALAGRGGEIMTCVYCSSVHLTLTNPSCSQHWLSPPHFTSPSLTTLIKSFHTMARRAENANVVVSERSDEKEREDNVSLVQVKTLSLSLSPPRVMYGVRTCWIVVLFSA